MPVGQVAAVQPPKVDLGHEMATIIIGAGENTKKFTIHKNLICAASDFCKTALNSKFVEGTAQTVQFPEENPQIFQLACDWLYTGRVAKGVTTYLKKEDVVSGDIFWWKVYQMADIMMMPLLRVLAIDKIQKLFCAKNPYVPSKKFIADLFDNGNLQDLGRYVVGHCAYWFQHSEDVSAWTALPDSHPTFARDLATATMEATKSRTVHPQAYTNGIREDGHLSPWKVAGVKHPGSKRTGGCTQVLEKHLIKAQEMDCCADVQMEGDGDGNTVANGGSTAAAAWEAGARPTCCLGLPDASTADGRTLIPILLPKDGLPPRSRRGIYPSRSLRFSWPHEHG